MQTGDKIRFKDIDAWKKTTFDNGNIYLSESTNLKVLGSSELYGRLSKSFINECLNNVYTFGSGINNENGSSFGMFNDATGIKYAYRFNLDDIVIPDFMYMF